jgi:hypothetical protein
MGPRSWNMSRRVFSHKPSPGWSPEGRQNAGVPNHRVRMSDTMGEVRSERGAVLILALIYIVSISVIVGALTTWALNDLNNTKAFHSASALDYAATSAVEVAVQSIRYAPLYSETMSPSLGYCWTPAAGYVSQLTVNNDTVAVWCSTVESLASAQTRVVTFYACKSTLTSSSSSPTVLAAAVACSGPNSDILTAKVTFDDYPPGGSAPLISTCTQACGQSATTDKWSFT